MPTTVCGHVETSQNVWDLDMKCGDFNVIYWRYDVALRHGPPPSEFTCLWIVCVLQVKAS